MTILLTGGSKSGKSLLAQELCRTLAAGGPMYYWATMDPVDGEDEARIARHREERSGWGFTTVEQGRALTEALPQIDPNGTVLFDSATAALANEMFAGETPDNTAWQRLLQDLLTVSRSCAHFVCVCDELWRDGQPYDAATEVFCRGLALICRGLADAFDTVAEVTAGCTKVWKGELPR